MFKSRPDTIRKPPSEKRSAITRQTPLKAIRLHCLDCSQSAKTVLWCTCTDCNLWMFRFGRRPENMPKELVTPSLFVDSYVNEDDLPNGVENAVKYLREAKESTL
jgi:hypothetical protein